MEGGRLALAQDGEPKMLLVPVSPTRFRIVGSPLSTFRFEVADGKVVRAVVEEGGVALRTLTPKGGA